MFKYRTWLIIMYKYLFIDSCYIIILIKYTYYYYLYYSLYFLGSLKLFQIPYLWPIAIHTDFYFGFEIENVEQVL